jgi:hypothetical protein
MGFRGQLSLRSSALVETAKLRGVNPRSFLRDAAMGVDVLAEDYQPSKPPIDPV